MPSADWRPRPGMLPTARSLRFLALILTGLSVREAAAVQNVTEQTGKHVLGDLYVRLGVSDMRAAGVLLGWIDVPPEFLGDVSAIPRRARPRRSVRAIRLCEECGEPFVARKAKMREGQGRFCSVSCSVAQRLRDRGAYVGGLGVDK